MGTRHLIAVQVDGEYKVAQYGQWDGYPSGQGVGILNFLLDMDKNAFAAAVRACTEITEDEYKAAWVSCGADPDSEYATLEVSQKFAATYPHFSRNCGSEILKHVQDAGADGLKVNLYLDFAADSLSCEWAYVIDLDKNTFEVFKGRNKTPLDPSERFANLEVDHSDGRRYYQVKLVKTYDLDRLPCEEEFVAELEGEDK